MRVEKVGIKNQEDLVFKNWASSSGMEGLIFIPEPISNPALVMSLGLICRYQCN